MTVEAVLILTLFLGIAIFVSNQFKQNELLASLVYGPWKNLSGMIQNGSWGEAEKTMDLHPARRPISAEGDLPK